MNILIVTQYFWPENFRINDLAVGLRQQGHQVTVLTGIPNYPAGKIFAGYGYFRNLRQTYEGIRVLRVPLIPRGRSGAVRLALNYLSFVFSASVLAPFLCRGKHDVIFAFGVSPVTVALPAIVLKWIKRVPMIFWVLDLWPDSLPAAGAVHSPRILSLVGKLVRFIYRQSDLVLVQSRGFVPHVQEYGADVAKIGYFPSWAEDLYTAGGTQAGTLPPMPEGFRIMFAGNVGAAQDFGSILAAAEALRDERDIHWVIVGDGRMHDWVQEQVLIRNLSATVHLLGRHALEMMPSFFARADAMLVSLRRAPIFSLTIPGKIQSYLAAGRPVIAMLDGEGARVVEESGAGIACPAEDVGALVDAVRTMHRMSKAEREAMGKNGLRYYEENFDRAMLFNRLESWMKKLGRTKAKD